MPQRLRTFWEILEHRSGTNIQRMPDRSVRLTITTPFPRFAARGVRPSQLRLRRLAAVLRISDIAHATGLPPTRVSEIERGAGPPVRAYELIQIERVLDDAESAQARALRSEP